MSRRFFYTDALAAAWMAKHFKMDFRIDDPDGKVFLETTLIHGLREWRDAISASTGYKFYIHPESQHLLEPHVGDIAKRDDGILFQVVPTCPENGPRIYLVKTAFEYPVEWAKQSFEDSALCVIQRNGIPFMWPESEAA